MAITLVATVGGVNSNSYVTVARANTLLEQLPHADEWLSDYTINKTQLLVHATRLIDRSWWFHGSKASTAQALEWPRQDVKDPHTMDELSSTAIPEFIELATIEWAWSLHLDAEQDIQIAPGLTRLRTPSYEAAFTGGGKRRIPQVVEDLLLPYGNKSPFRMIRLMRA